MRYEGCQGLLEHGKLQSDGPLHSSPGLVKSYHEQPILQQSTQHDLPWSCAQPITCDLPWSCAQPTECDLPWSCAQRAEHVLPWSCAQSTESLQALLGMRAIGNVIMVCFVKLSSGHIIMMQHVLFGLLHRPRGKLSIARCCCCVVCVLQKSGTFSWHS